MSFDPSMNAPPGAPPQTTQGFWHELAFILVSGVRAHWRKLALGLVSVGLFIWSIQVMKAGARPLQPVLHDQLSVDGLWDGLGFGWLGAAVILSGSPIAAMALALQDVGAISALAAFGMINGSRIGAAFMVLLMGFLYMRRGADRSGGLSVGLIALLVVQTVHLPAILAGALLVEAGTLHTAHFGDVQEYTSMIDLLFDPLVTVLVDLLPDWTLFFIGLGLMIISFRLINRAVPHRLPRSDVFQRLKPLIAHPLSLFALGLGITFITLSVSVSLGMLVPLSARNLISRKHMVPYVMGAGISTFIDTLVAALVLQDPATITVIVVQMLTITVVSLVYIGLAWRFYERAVLGAADYLLAHPRALWGYMGAFVLVPLALVLT